MWSILALLHRSLFIFNTRTFCITISRKWPQEIGIFPKCWGSYSWGWTGTMVIEAKIIFCGQTIENTYYWHDSDYHNVIMLYCRYFYDFSSSLNALNLNILIFRTIFTYVQLVKKTLWMDQFSAERPLPHRYCLLSPDFCLGHAPPSSFWHPA